VLGTASQGNAKLGTAARRKGSAPHGTAKQREAKAWRGMA